MLDVLCVASELILRNLSIFVYTNLVPKYVIKRFIVVFVIFSMYLVTDYFLGYVLP